MTEPSRDTQEAKVYLREWMEARGYNGKQLAERIERSTSSISKKLGDPLRIDVEWLYDLARGLDINVVDLFRHPDEAPQPPQARQKMLELTKALSSLSDNQIDNLIGIFRPAPGAELPQEQGPESAAEPRSKEPTGQ
jgi:transcriptional regulator with XRE-family HTH domain